MNSDAPLHRFGKRDLKHPFVRGMADGSLPTEKFKFYLIQDYLFLLRL